MKNNAPTISFTGDPRTHRLEYTSERGWQPRCGARTRGCGTRDKGTVTCRDCNGQSTSAPLPRVQRWIRGER